MAEDGRDLVAARALDVHEVRVWMLDKSLQFVLALLILGTRMQEVLGKLKVDQAIEARIEQVNVF